MHEIVSSVHSALTTAAAARQSAWFEDRGPMCTALVYVDDTTSRLMTMYFCGAESTFGYFEATRQYIDHYVR
jgi:hypothetical protein